MELINISEKSPLTFYIFINFNNQLTKLNIENNGSICSAAFYQLITNSDKKFANEYFKGMISAYSGSSNKKDDFVQKYIKGTVDYLPFEANQDCDINFLSMFNKGITSSYRTEFNCEKSRQYYFPLYPSRLSSCFAFGDWESCVKASKKYGWELKTVREFELIPHKHNRVAKVNMEIISLLRAADNVSSMDAKTIDLIWKSYWSGESNISLELPSPTGKKKIDSGIMWEYLIEGLLKLKK